MSAAEEVCADGPDADQVMPTVIRLVDKSVIVRIDGAADAGGAPTQYRMLDTIREFGAERLDASGAAGGTRRRFIARYLAMATYFRDHFLDDDQLARMRELRREHANVRAALEYAFGESEAARDSDGVELAIALARLLACPRSCPRGQLLARRCRRAGTGGLGRAGPRGA